MALYWVLALYSVLLNHHYYFQNSLVNTNRSPIRQAVLCRLCALSLSQPLVVMSPVLCRYASAYSRCFMYVESHSICLLCRVSFIQHVTVQDIWEMHLCCIPYENFIPFYAWINTKNSIIWLYHILFICSFPVGQLNSFCFLAVRRNVAMNTEHVICKER